MSRVRSKKGIRLSVTLDEKEYAELTKLGSDLDLSSAWMIRRTVSEFITRYRDDPDIRIPVKMPETSTSESKKQGAR